jgi:hypothetical protein
MLAARARMTAIAVVTLSFIAGCDDFFFYCPLADDADLAVMPTRLSETGLYSDLPTGGVSEDVIAYRPTFELWSDGAAKRRWIYLPAGSTIDTSDLDSWSFPTGTKLWKEFSRDGVRVETRLLHRIADGQRDWVGQSYVWASDQSEAEAAPLGFIDASGTEHDVPAAGECVGCHGGRASFVLGFSAVQLSAPGEGHVDVNALSAMGWLSAPPQQPIVVPGGENTRKALGYLHANCGHCHNRARPSDAPCFDPNNRLDFWLTTDLLASPERTPAYTSAVGDRILPGRPSESLVIRRMSTRSFIYRMPPLGSERVDRDAIDTVSQWILELD